MGDAVHVSRRTVAAILAAGALIAATWKTATAVAQHVERVVQLEAADVDTHLRMCQWERAFQEQGFKIAPWHTCPAMVKP